MPPPMMNMITTERIPHREAAAPSSPAWEASWMANPKRAGPMTDENFPNISKKPKNSLA